MTRHPADDFDMARFNISPGAAAEAWSQQRAAYEREQRQAQPGQRPPVRRRHSPGATVGGCLVLVAILAVGFACGFAVAIIGLAA
jgi:hypothetical protein